MKKINKIIIMVMFLLTCNILASIKITYADLNQDINNYFKLNETSGTYAYDMLGNSTLTISNTAGIVSGLLDNAFNCTNAIFPYTYLYDGFTSHYAFLSNGSTDYTINLWIKLNQSSGVRKIMSNTPGANIEGIELYVNDSNHLNFNIGRVSPYPVIVVTENSVQITPNTWTMITIVYSNNTTPNVKMYINSNLVGEANKTNPNSVTTPPYGMNFGRYASGGQYLNGVIDEIGIWKRTLTSSEITFLYNSGSPTINQQYPFNENYENSCECSDCNSCNSSLNSCGVLNITSDLSTTNSYCIYNENLSNKNIKCLNNAIIKGKVLLKNSSNINISDCVFNLNTPTNFYALDLQYTNNTNLYNNTFINSSVRVVYSNNTNLYNNSFTNLTYTYGIVFDNANNSNFYNNIIQNTTGLYGLTLLTSANIKIWNNIFNLTSISMNSYNSNISFNTTKQAVTNIIGGSYTCGNYYYNFSNNVSSCKPQNEGLCQEYYQINNFYDYCPITYFKLGNVSYTPILVTPFTPQVNCSIYYENLNIGYKWFVNGVFTGVTNYYITNNSYTSNDKLVCEVNASDGVNSYYKNSSNISVNSIYYDCENPHPVTNKCLHYESDTINHTLIFNNDYDEINVSILFDNNFLEMQEVNNGTHLIFYNTSVIPLKTGFIYPTNLSYDTNSSIMINVSKNGNFSTQTLAVNRTINMAFRPYSFNATSYNIIETMPVNYTLHFINLTNNGVVIKAIIEVNNTNYTYTEFQNPSSSGTGLSPTLQGIVNNIYITNLINNNNETISLRAWLNLTLGSQSILRNFTPYNVTIHKMQLFNCSITDTTNKTAYVLYFRDLSNNSYINLNNDSSLKIDYWVYNNSKYRNITFNLDNYSNYRVCFLPNFNYTWYSNFYFYGTATNYMFSNLIYYNKTFTNTSFNNITIYFMNILNYSIIRIHILDYDDMPLSNLTVFEYAINPVTFEEQLLSSQVSDYLGTTTFAVNYNVQNNNLYNFKVYNGSVFLAETGRIAPTLTDYYIRIKIFNDTYISNVINKWLINYSLTADKDLNSCNFTWYDIIGFGNQYCLRVVDGVNYTSNVLFFNCSSNNTGFINYTLPAVNEHTYTCYALVNSNNNLWYILDFKTLDYTQSILKTDGLILAFIIVGVCFFLGLWKPAISIILGTISFIFLMIIGLINLPVLIIGGVLIVLSIIIIIKMKV